MGIASHFWTFWGPQSFRHEALSRFPTITLPPYISQLCSQYSKLRAAPALRPPGQVLIKIAQIEQLRLDEKLGFLCL